MNPYLLAWLIYCVSVTSGALLVAQVFVGFTNLTHWKRVILFGILVGWIFVLLPAGVVDAENQDSALDDEDLWYAPAVIVIFFSILLGRGSEAVGALVNIGVILTMVVALLLGMRAIYKKAKAEGVSLDIK